MTLTSIEAWQRLLVCPRQVAGCLHIAGIAAMQPIMRSRCTSLVAAAGLFCPHTLQKIPLKVNDFEPGECATLPPSLW